MANNDDDDSLQHPSPDDALEPPDDIYNPRVDEEHLEEDYDPPFTPGSPHITTPKLPPDHPAIDTNVDPHEAYDEGDTSATDYDAQEEQTDPDALYPPDLDTDVIDEDEDRERER